MTVDISVTGTVITVNTAPPQRRLRVAEWLSQVALAGLAASEDTWHRNVGQAALGRSSREADGWLKCRQMPL